MSVEPAAASIEQASKPMDFDAMVAAGLISTGKGVLSVVVGAASKAQTLATADLSNDGKIVLANPKAVFDSPYPFCVEVMRRESTLTGQAPRPVNRPFTTVKLTACGTSLETIRKQYSSKSVPKLPAVPARRS